MVDHDWTGSARFAVRRTLGSGGMGVVYHAYDRQRGQDVALKTLKLVEPEAIYRLKREFRSVLELSHPNLVQTFELGSEDGHWFISMELVRGMTFLEYVSDHPPRKIAEPTVAVSARTSPMSAGVTIHQPLDEGWVEDTEDDATLAEKSAETADRPGLAGRASALTLGRDVLALYRTVKRPAWDAQPTDDPVLEGLDTTRERPTARAHLDRLRSATRQLAEGLLAIHAAGKLHRDVKPSNVLVTPSGRVVILDFGLMTELFPDPAASFTEHGIAGTVPYMAPEIASPAARSPAVDWYAVGVMLYEALAGRLPYLGTGIDVIFRKQREDPAAPSAYRPAIPTDLEALAMALLSRDPARRPTGPQVLELLGSGSDRLPAPSIMPRRPTQGAPFVGRQRHLDALDAALGRAKLGRPTLVLVRGQSGIGKSTLIKTFLDEVRDREGALVLSGRCHERESVPFKAFDIVIDGLARHLDRLPSEVVARVLPRSIRALARIFPTLLRVDAIERAPRLPAETPDAQELRRRAFAALTELLSRLTELGPVVIFIDDLQWGDEDSALLLLELLKQPGGAPVLFVAAHRQEGETTSPVLRILRERGRGVGAELKVLTVGTLTHDEARDLALSLLQGTEGDLLGQAEQIAREARGNPFFVEQLAQHSQREAARLLTPLTGEISLDRVLEKRLQRLSRPSRRVLELVAVAGRPFELELVGRLAVLSTDDLAVVVNSLKTAHLLRSQGVPPHELVEPYHDRVREALLSQLPAETQREFHRAIAETLERLPEPPAESIFFHWREAGDVARATRFATVAAEAAARALAFDRAAQLYTVALEASTPADRRRITIRLAEALALAGRGAAAAERYLEAAAQADAAEATELKRLAAERFLTSGHIDQGLDLLAEVLGAVGLRLASTPRGAYFSRVWRRGQLWRRGFAFTPRRVDELPREKVQKIDTLWSSVLGLALFDFIRAADFQTRHVLLALDAGEPYRIARAMALEAGFVSTGGGHGQWRTAKLIEELHRVADQSQHPHAQGLAAFAEGAAAYFEGGWGRARVLLERAEQLYQDGSVNVAWELMASRMLLHSTLFHLGQIAALARRAAEMIEDADARGDLFAGTIYRVGQSTAVWLAADNPERAARSIEDGLSQWSKRGYYIQQATAMMSRTMVALYGARLAEASAIIEADWGRLDRGYFLKLQYFRIGCLYQRGLAAVGLAHAEPKRKASSLALAERCADALEAEKMRWATPLAAALRAGVADHRGQADRAIRALRNAVTGFQAVSMSLHEAAARLRLGETLGGDEGRALIEQALARMSTEGVRSPIRYTLAMVPISSRY